MGDRMGSSPINRTIKETSFVYQGKRGFLLLSGQNTGAILKNRAPERPIGCYGALFLCFETRKQVYFLLFFRVKKNVKKVQSKRT